MLCAEVSRYHLGGVPSCPLGDVDVREGGLPGVDNRRSDTAWAWSFLLRARSRCLVPFITGNVSGVFQMS